MPQSAPYTLNLDRSRTARAFDPGESLWTPELARIFQLLRQQVATLEQRQGEAPLLAIAVFGGHGSGKTSLLHTLSDRVRNPGKIQELPPSEDKDALLRHFGPLENLVRCLPLLKPNILAPHESFLYAFLAAAVEAEQDVLEREGSRSRTSDQHYLSPVQQAFQNVSEYLQVIDDTGERQEYDPLGVSLERLERHTSDLRLKDAMRELINVLANRLAAPSNSLVLMPVDDADLSQESLSNTLDTFRRYLQHPRLVPVFTFTGRLSEELLTTHFSDKLRGKERSPRGGEDWRLFEKQIAHQYFARLFPVRNRIRLGATTVRVQRASYTVQSSGASGPGVGPDAGNGQESRYGGQVSELLETASRLLFGHPEDLVEPRVVLALRPGRLRRQLQILDVLNATRVTAVVAGDYESLEPAEASERWAKIFERTAWSLLDVHRDVLSPLGLHVEELYGWPSHGLREWVLVRILDQDLDRRQTLLRRWRHRTEDRRGQVFSLLAANAFRPALAREELVPGQEPYRDGGGLDHAESNGRGLTVDKGLLWFLGLWLGFYLPQIVTREHGKANEGMASTGVGWTLTDAPMLAMRAAKNLGEVVGAGTLFLHPEAVSRFMKQGMVDDGGLREILKMQLWCFHGFEQSESWVALSLWRGLSFLGQVLKVLEDYDGGEAAREEAVDWVDKLLERHLADGWIPSSLRPQRSTSNQLAQAGPGHEPSPNDADDGNALHRQIDPRRMAPIRRELAVRVVEWMESCRTALFMPIDPLSQARRREHAHDFLWRLQGDSLLGGFWLELDRVIYDLPKHRRNAQDILETWWGVLETYLTGPRPDADGADASKTTDRSGNPDESRSSEGPPTWVEALREVLGVHNVLNLDTARRLVAADRPPEGEEETEGTTPDGSKGSPQTESGGDGPRAEAGGDEAEAPE